MLNDIGVVGLGVVGTAVLEGMKHAFRVETYDPFKPCSTQSIEHLFRQVDGPIFVAVPTPMTRDGSCDTSIVESVVAELNDVVRRTIGEPAEHAPVVIKSTVPPGTTYELNQRYKYLRVVFNPEFLTEANAVDDFKEQTRIIIGGPHGSATLIKRVYQVAYPTVPTTKTSSTVAEMVKYVTNCFLATKVSLANEFHQICQALSKSGYDIDYDKVIEYALQDDRLGKSHWAVPGPMPDQNGELKPGFSGSCFCKDICAMIHKSRQVGVDPKVMAAAWEKNLEVRPERDWELLKGRAVSSITPASKGAGLGIPTLSN